MHLSDAVAKNLLRKAYAASCGAQVLCNTFLPRKNGLAVYYGGARSGGIGGPLVKVKRLREYFPEVQFGYNLAYLLSNTPYLPGFALTLLKRGNIPIVYNQNGVFYKAWYAGDWEAENRRMALPYHAADWVFYQSEFCRLAAEKFLGRRSGPGEVLYNAVDTEVFSPLPNGPEKIDERFTFLLTGKIDSHLYYRLESTINGLRVACVSGLDAHLVVAGWVAADAKSRAEQLARNLGIDRRVVFSGPYTQEQAPMVYRKADAYVMTKHNDPCPNTVLEALSTGLPVLYSDSGGVPELVGTEAGVPLACPEDWDVPRVPTAEAIGEGMLRVAANRSTYATAARRRAVARFDITYWTNRHRKVFERLVFTP